MQHKKKAKEKSERKKAKEKSEKRRERMRKKRERRKRKKKAREKSERRKEKILMYGEVDKRAVRSVAYWAYASRQCVQRIAVVAVGEGAGGRVAVAYRGYRPAAVAA